MNDPKVLCDDSKANLTVVFANNNLLIVIDQSRHMMLRVDR